MSEVNYLGYAQLVGQRNPTAEGLATLGQSLDQMQATDRQRKMDAMTMEQNRRASSLADLQMQQTGLNLAQDRAGSLAMIGQYGTGDRPDFQTQLADAVAFQGQEKQDLADQEAARKNALEKVKTFTDTFKSFADAVHNDTMDAESATKAFPGLMKHLGMDYSKAGISFTFGKGGGYYSGPIKETDLIRVNGKEVPYGSAGIVEKARVVGLAPDGKTPIYEIDKNTTFKEAATDKIQVVEIPSPDGKTSQKYRVNLATGDKTPLGEPFAVKSQVPNINVTSGNSNKSFQNESAMRKEFLTLPEVKEYPTIQQNSMRALKALSEQGKGSNVAVDQSIITVFNKMLDPASVVRESEYARTPQDLSVLSRIRGKWDKVQRGGAGLDKTEREALHRMIKNFNDVADTQYNAQVDYYSGLAKRYGYSPENVVRLGGAKSGNNQDQINSTKKPAAPKVGTIQDGYVFKGGNPADPKSWAKKGR